MTRVGSPAVCESTNGTECMTPSDARFHGCQIAGAREPRKKKLSRKDAKADREWTRRKERRNADIRGILCRNVWEPNLELVIWGSI